MKDVTHSKGYQPVRKTHITCAIHTEMQEENRKRRSCRKSTIHRLIHLMIILLWSSMFTARMLHPVIYEEDCKKLGRATIAHHDEWMFRGDIEWLYRSVPWSEERLFPRVAVPVSTHIVGHLVKMSSVSKEWRRYSILGWNIIECAGCVLQMTCGSGELKLFWKDLKCERFLWWNAQSSQMQRRKFWEGPAAWFYTKSKMFSILFVLWFSVVQRSFN